MLGMSASVLLVSLGVLFAIASIEHASRLSVGIVLMACGFGILYAIRKKRATAAEIAIPGRVSVQSLKCPNCSAQLDPSQMKMRGGVPIVECHYCGSALELTEEPKW